MTASSSEPKCFHHGRIHIGVWNGVVPGVRRQRASHSGAKAARSSDAVMTDTRRVYNPPRMSVKPFRIIRNIYYVGASDVTAYLIATPKGHILIDGGFVETAPMILANVKKLGFDPHDIRIL